MKNPVRPESFGYVQESPFGYAQESLVEGRAGFFIHTKGEYVVGRPCFDIALKKQLFCICKINDLPRYKNTKNYVKQRLFHGNAMRPKGAYFAQHERPTTYANCSF